MAMAKVQLPWKSQWQKYDFQENINGKSMISRKTSMAKARFQKSGGVIATCPFPSAVNPLVSCTMHRCAPTYSEFLCLVVLVHRDISLNYSLFFNWNKNTKAMVAINTFSF